MRWTFASILFIFFSACTGGTNKPPMNGDGSLGIISKSYYHTETDNRISIVQTTNFEKAERLEFDPTNGLKDFGPIDYARLRFNTDRTILAIQGEPQLFEMRSVKPEELKTSPAAIPRTNLEALCLTDSLNGMDKIGTSSVREFHISHAGSDFQFVTYSSATPVVLNPNSTATTSETVNELDYTDPNYGSVQILLAQASTLDPSFYKSVLNFPAAPELSSAQNIYCHTNHSAPPNPIVSSNALFSSSRFYGEQWGDQQKGLSPDQQFTSVTLGKNGNSTELMLKGYFTSYKHRLPTDATIDGFNVQCNWYSPLPDGVTTITNDKYDVSIDSLMFLKGPDDYTHNYGGEILPLVPTLSSIYGYPNTTGPDTWTPQEINSPEFGVVFEATNGMRNYTRTVYVDYCQLSVFWHNH